MIVTKDTVVLNDTFYTPEVHVTDTFVTSKYDTIELIAQSGELLTDLFRSDDCSKWHNVNVFIVGYKLIIMKFVLINIL